MDLQPKNQGAAPAGSLRQAAGSCGLLGHWSSFPHDIHCWYPATHDAGSLKGRSHFRVGKTWGNMQQKSWTWAGFVGENSKVSKNMHKNSRSENRKGNHFWHVCCLVFFEAIAEQWRLVVIFSSRIASRILGRSTDGSVKELDAGNIL